MALAGIGYELKARVVVLTLIEAGVRYPYWHQLARSLFGWSMELKNGRYRRPLALYATFRS